MLFNITLYDEVGRPGANLSSVFSMAAVANGNKGEALSEGTLGNSRWARDFLLAIDLRSGHSLARHISFGIFTNWDWTMHLQLTLESEQIQLTLES